MTIVGLLIRGLGGLMALGGAGVLGIPRLALAVNPGLAAVGLLLKAALSVGCLAFAVTHRGKLGAQRPPAPPQRASGPRSPSAPASCSSRAAAYWACPAAYWASATACATSGSRGLVAITPAA